VSELTPHLLSFVSADLSSFAFPAARHFPLALLVGNQITDYRNQQNLSFFTLSGYGTLVSGFL
jgi:hypothetical protein